MKKTLFIIFACSAIISAYSSDNNSEKIKMMINNPKQIKSERTTTSERNKFLENLNENIIKARILKGLNKENESNWNGVFWAAELTQNKSDLVKNAIAEVFTTWQERSESLQRAALEAAYALFPNEFEQNISELLTKTENPKLFAMMSYYLLRASYQEHKDRINSIIKKHYDGNNPIIKFLTYSISCKNVQTPDISDLLSAKSLKNYTVIISLQRKNRKYPGLTIIRKADGSFLRNSDGTLFSIPELAMSVTNMPGTLTNGNTPEGIYSVTGLDFSTNVFIGPTPTIISAMPFEITPEEFLHNSKYEKWNLDYYKNLLPGTWQNYLPIYEAFYAGDAGRSEVILHGTTINPDFYKNEPYYPMTPSLGCLCSTELWNSENGLLDYSDQVALIKKFTSLNLDKGFLIVVNIDDKNEPVTLTQILPEILKAEKY